MTDAQIAARDNQNRSVRGVRVPGNVFEFAAGLSQPGAGGVRQG